MQSGVFSFHLGHISIFIFQRWDNKKSKSYTNIKDLVMQKNWIILERLMMNRLKFGTAGIRGKMGPGY